MRDQLIKEYVRENLREYTEKEMKKLEMSGKTGIEKMNKLVEGFWEKARDYVIREKAKNSKAIPDEIENATEDIILEAIEVLRGATDVRKFAQGIFDNLKNTGQI